MKSKSMASVNFENQCVSDAIGESRNFTVMGQVGGRTESRDFDFAFVSAVFSVLSEKTFLSFSPPFHLYSSLEELSVSELFLLIVFGSRLPDMVVRPMGHSGWTQG